MLIVDWCVMQAASTYGLVSPSEIRQVVYLKCDEKRQQEQTISKLYTSNMLKQCKQNVNAE